MIAAYESICYLAGTERDSGNLLLSKRDCVELVELVKKLRADARALWAVRVLDAHQAHITIQLRTCLVPGYGWTIRDGLDRPLNHVDYRSPNPDAARLAAALAVFPELTADVRAELGECP